MSSPNLESLTNELSKLGAHLGKQKHQRPPHGTPNRPLMNTQMVPLMEPRMECLTDT